MNHYRIDHWLQYVRDELDDETRIQYENHLYDCDHCLELYLQAVDANEFQMPELAEPNHFTDSIMKQVQEINTKEDQPKIRAKHSYKQTFIHYSIAVAMTFILMSTGVFSQLLKMPHTIENSESKQSESFIQSFLNKQGSIINKFEMDVHFKEGKHNE
ncbi:hypothetical protein MUB24_08695 [Lederbergia sp. NSJ-179]|uniref:anti-sigma factor family protein n=1 Tax=Lederbergia sp. NSJ-179 TaxID=2931402 RepID=UPI001FD43457|nr:hypothetical protein [Lederbergia sp. NSJ-179]MCJ7840978.1 hypothetical protein [Lederbergia sp. NSJ-179]